MTFLDIVEDVQFSAKIFLLKVFYDIKSYY